MIGSPIGKAIAIWSYEYLGHLTQVIGTLAEHGNCIIIGRGANYLLPHRGVLKVRIIAPIKMRVRIIMKKENSEEDAKRKLIMVDSERKAFTRQYFNTDIDDPVDYDLVINTGYLSIEKAAKIIKDACCEEDERIERDKISVVS
jgi:cytidylate kinase